MKTMKMNVSEDKYLKNKKKYDKDGKEYGMEYQPVNMHGRPSLQSKKAGDSNAKAKIDTINKQQGNC